jgi:hypothetical protein
LKKCLPLAWSAPPIARLAMMTDLCNVAAHSFPPPDLAHILFRQSAAEIISAIPLKPAARTGQSGEEVRDKPVER